jgi:predicted ATPase/class 3 adenylate cyclase
MQNPPGGTRPTGTVTFLFTDIEESTKRWETNPADMQAAFSRQEAILRHAIEANGGYAYKVIGDGSQAAFSTALQAVQAAIDAQLLLFTEQWPPSFGELSVRIALHTAVIEERVDYYAGPALNRMARLLSAGHGGQVLLSAATQELVRDHLSILQPNDPPGVQLLDMGEHRLKDLTRPERIFQLVVPGLPSLFPPLRTLDSLPNNLPRQSTPLVGREKQTADVVALLGRSDVSLVTLTGPAGTGKTRLSLEVAARMLEEYKDGVWFVELAILPPEDHRLVPSTIAETLHVREVPGQAVIDTLNEYLRDKEMLLVLDNFEQVAPAAPQIASLLKAAPHLKALVSSRIALQVYGERAYRVPPLSLPDRKLLTGGQHTDERRKTRDQRSDSSLVSSRAPLAGQEAQQVDRLIQEYLECEAVRLFVERCQAVKADFEITSDNAPEIASICTRLDGLPLAIELAAARIKLFTPQALLSRLSDRLKILTGGAKDLPARQQTMRGAFEWSYDLLSEEEKQLFSRLAVFNGGSTLEAIETVCNSDGSLQIDVLDGVQSLLDKSLLVEREGSDRQPRYRMLETIQEYAEEKLKESAEAAILQREHALYIMRLAEEAEPHMTDKDQQEWLDRLEDEHDNIRAALEWASASAQVGVQAAGEEGSDEASNEAGEVGLRIGGALWRFWYVRGLYTEGRELLYRAISASEASGSGGQRRSFSTSTLSGKGAMGGEGSTGRSMAKALTGEGALAYRQGDYTSAHSLLEAAFELGREVGDKQTAANALNMLGNVTFDQGDYPAARALYEESLALKREIGDKYGIAASLSNLGNVVADQGDYPAARALYEESLPLTREIGDKWGIAVSLSNLGAVAFLQGDYPAARALEEESLSLKRELGDKSGIAASLSNLGSVAFDEGDYPAARALYEESLSLTQEIGDKKGATICLAGLGEVAVCLAGGSEQEGHVTHAEQLERSVKLLGAVEGLLQSISVVLDRADRPPYERSVNQARDLLGEEIFKRAWDEGRTMSMEQAVEYAFELAAVELDRSAAEEERLEGQRQVDELHINIDQEKKKRHVEAITGTEYFQELQARARVLLLERQERGE